VVSVAPALPRHVGPYRYSTTEISDADALHVSGAVEVANYRLGRPLRNPDGWTAWRRAAPELRQHWPWFLLFGVLSQLFYTEFKNVIARTAHLKEAMRERRWKVTPRSIRVDELPTSGLSPADATTRRAA